MKADIHEFCQQTGLAIEADVVDQLVTYANLIARWDKVVNLVGSSAPNHLVQTHLLDCLAAVRYVDGATIADIGSGAGLPGIVFGLMRPDRSVFLVEARQKKSRFLRQAVIELALANVTVVPERVEHWRPDQRIDILVCRGYGKLEKFVRDTRHLQHSASQLVALKGAIDSAEISAAEQGGVAVRVAPVAVPGWDHRHVVTMSIAETNLGGQQG